MRGVLPTDRACWPRRWQDRYSELAADRSEFEAYRRVVAEHAVEALGARTTWTSLLPGGQSHGMVPADFSATALVDGTEIELEHTTDPRVAMEIAMDHLAEDRSYYAKLRSMHRETCEAMDPRVHAILVDLRDSSTDLEEAEDPFLLRRQLAMRLQAFLDANRGCASVSAEDVSAMLALLPSKIEVASKHRADPDLEYDFRIAILEPLEIARCSIARMTRNGRSSNARLARRLQRGETR